MQTLTAQSIMVAVDCHLHRSFVELDWVHADTKTPLESSILISYWLPKEEYININNIIAGLCQLLQSKKYRDEVLSLSKESHCYHLVKKLYYMNN